MREQQRHSFFLFFFSAWVLHPFLSLMIEPVGQQSQYPTVLRIKPEVCWPQNVGRAQDHTLASDGFQSQVMKQWDRRDHTLMKPDIGPDTVMSRALTPTPLATMIMTFSYNPFPGSHWEACDYGLGTMSSPVNLYFLCCKLLFLFDWALMHVGKWTPSVQ